MHKKVSRVYLIGGGGVWAVERAESHRNDPTARYGKYTPRFGLHGDGNTPMWLSEMAETDDLDEVERAKAHLAVLEDSSSIDALIREVIALRREVARLKGE